MKPWERQYDGAPWERQWTDDQPQGATDRQKLISSPEARLLKGLKDPIDAGAQLLTHMLPEGAVNAVNSGVQALNSLPVIGPAMRAIGMTPADSGQIDKDIAESEQEYQAARQATAPKTLSGLVTGKRDPGMDVSRGIGNLLFGLAIPGGSATTMPKLVAQGAAAGGAAGLLQPVVNNQDEYWTEKAKQGGTGAVVGGAVAPLAAGLARVISPKTRPEVKSLLDEGITPTPGQIMGGNVQRLEDKMTSVPLLGDAIRSSRRAGLDEFNRAAYARALRPIGEKADDLPVGREGVAAVRDKLDDAYNALLPKLGFRADPQFSGGVQQVEGMIATLPKQVGKEFQTIYKKEVVGRMTPQGLMNGRSFKDAESGLGAEIRRLSRDPDRHSQQLADALKEVRNLLRQGLERSNPAYADDLAKINKGYSAYTKVRDAGSRLGDKSSGFTPADLASAVRKGDTSVGKGNFASGRANMQDLSDAGVSVLASKYPDSGTAGRMMVGMGALGGGGYINPMIPIVGGASMLPYLPGGRQAIAALLARRPQGAEALASGLREAAPKLSAGVAALVKQITQQ